MKIFYGKQRVKLKKKLSMLKREYMQDNHPWTFIQINELHFLLYHSSIYNTLFYEKIMRRDYILKRLKNDGYSIEPIGRDYVISRNGDTFFGKLNKVFYEIYGYVDKTNMINTK